MSLYNLLQEVDIAIGSITITGSRSTVVDFPVSYYETASGKVVCFNKRKQNILEYKMTELF